MKAVIFEDEAKSEFRRSAKYYERERPGRGKKFIAEVTAVLKHIGRYPFAAPIIWGDFRRARVRHFPYNIIYSVEEDHVAVVAVMHQRRDPDLWKDRI